MAYAFRQDDASVAAGLRRIGLDQIDSAIAEIGDGDLPLSERIHRVRKRCKKVRGLIRLVRPAFSSYARENVAFRDIARPLSAPRDAEAQVAAWDALAKHFDSVLRDGATAPLREGLVAAGSSAETGAEPEDRLTAARDALYEARDRACDWALDDEGWTAISGGLRKSYARARAAMADARMQPDATHTHLWRKRVKYHRCHARLLAHIDDRVMPGHIGRASDLSDCLGDHHDLHVLEPRIEAADVDIPAEAREAVIALLRDRRDRLEADAFDLGARLLTEKPNHLVRRWRPLWDHWRA